MIIYNGTYTVYAHINKINKKIYVGITSTDPKERWKNGKAYRENTHIYKAIKKYGWNNFDHVIIASNLTQEEAFYMEKMLIDKLDLKNNKIGYNMIDGGSMPPIHKGENHPNYGKNLPENTKKKISESKKGHSNGKHSEETKDKIRKSRIGKSHPCSEARKKKVSERMSGSKNPRAKKVLCVELNVTFPTARDACIFIGRNKGAVASAIFSGCKAGGYTWRYV